jgi:8-oxo-dGTP pyrophosphatase MutT (NUDIX family)
MKIASLGFIVQRDLVLLGEKKRAEIGTGKLNGAGGKLEKRDRGDIEKCLVRETQEEFGVTPTEFRKTARILFYAGGVLDFEVHIFLVTTWEGEAKETESMHAPAWYPIHALPYDRMHDSDLHWIDAVFKGDPFTAHVYYRERGAGFERIEFLEELN